MTRKSAIDPDGLRLPVKLDTTTNGEFAPIPLDPVHRHANRLAHSHASDHARRLHVGRRQFLLTSCGVASTLLAFNAAYAAAGKTGGYYQLAADSAFDQQLADSTLAGQEFIFDVQGHFVNPSGQWLRRYPDHVNRFSSFARRNNCDMDNKAEQLNCLNAEKFIQDVFLDSDTDLMVLSFVPSQWDAEPLTIEEATATAKIVEKMEGTHRLLLHGRVNPNQPKDMESMAFLAKDWKIAAWKTYTQWGPDGNGFWLDDEKIGIPFLEQARALGVPRIAVHKGLPFGQESYQHSTCADIGRVAKKYPDLTFLIYHSGFVPGAPEGPYNPDREDGIDGLVTSLMENDVPPNSNVYAELGSTWRYLMRDPDSAAHGLGKLLKYVGEDNVLWGTDSIWYGSPQDQIQAFRAFQISAQLREQYGYPEITPAIRAKVFGLNALKPYGEFVSDLLPKFGGDTVARLRQNYRQAPDPHFQTYGPKNRREFLNFLRLNGDRPA